MNVGVLGAGTMGHGIAQVCAMADHEVTMRDVDQGIVDDGLAAIEANLDEGVERGKVTEDERAATLANLSGTTALDEAVTGADVVIEAVPERMDLKQQVFEEVDDHASLDAVVATNTSSMSVTEIATAITDPSRVIGLHFYNPVHIMPPVEVVVAEQTSDETLAFSQEFVDGIGKEYFTVEDFAGFASARLGVVHGLEAMRMVQDGVAPPRDVDMSMELGYNHPMGPLKLSDFVGLDVRLDILEYLTEELGERFRPPQILRQKVRAGKHGKKTGEGFYVWEDGEVVGMADDYGRSP